jgi:hypothetical protein
MVNTSRWDTGVQAHGVSGIVEWTGSVTAGSLSDPRFGDNNQGRQLAGRAVVRPMAAATFGVSAARGAWLDDTLEREVAGPTDDRSEQVAFGVDAEFSRGPFLVRGEAIRSSWAMPESPTLLLDEPLVAFSTLIEGRYKVAPGFYVAARGERLDFSTVRGERGLAEWEAETWRFESGIGYSFTRNILAKVVWQSNHRDGGRVRRDSLFAGQVLYWF